MLVNHDMAYWSVPIAWVGLPPFPLYCREPKNDNRRTDKPITTIFYTKSGFPTATAGRPGPPPVIAGVMCPI